MNVQDAYLKNVQATYRYYCYHVNNPVKEELAWIPSKFHIFLCDKIQEFIERKTDKAYEILILNTPPQHGKSKTVTETLPSWYLMRNPDNSVIEVSYGDDLAERFGKANLEKVKEYGDIFGVRVDKKKSTSREFQIAGRKGRMISKGIGSGLTGHSGHLIVIDDPIKNRMEADSESRRDFIWNEFVDSIISRTQRGSKIILIMTRWHEDDLAGRIMREMSDKAELINLPCEAEDNDPLGRKPGEPLCPEIGKDETWLMDFKATFISEQGSRSWEALYQGHPSILEGNMLKREWWRFYDLSQLNNIKWDNLVISVDATFKDQKSNDFVCISVWGKADNRIYLVDIMNERMNFPETVRAIQIMKARHPKSRAILIEDKANGAAIIQVLRKKVMGVISVTPREGKEARVEAVSVFIEAGNVYLPNNKKKTWDFIDQCASFPNGKHDDMVDSMTMALKRLIFTKGSHAKLEEIASSWNIPKRGRKAEKIHVI